jgi:hypothetical protein
LEANYFIIVLLLVWACVGVHVGVMGMPCICPGARIFFCLEANYFIVVLLLLWACVGVHAGVQSKLVLFFFSSCAMSILLFFMRDVTRIVQKLVLFLHFADRTSRETKQNAAFFPQLFKKI